MRLSVALRLTMAELQIANKDLAAAAELNPSQLSSFKRGGNLRSDSIERILEALDQVHPGALQHFYEVLRRNSLGGCWSGKAGGGVNALSERLSAI